MMAKLINTIIVAVMILLIATFVISALSLQSKTDKVLTTYSARREELATKQQQIQDMIVSLNSTLQSQMEAQQVIATQLGVKLNTTIPAPVVQPSQPVSTPAPVVSTPPPQPVPTPQPMRRTSAS